MTFINKSHVSKLLQQTTTVHSVSMLCIGYLTNDDNDSLHWHLTGPSANVSSDFIHIILNVQNYRKSCFPCVQNSDPFLPQWKQPSSCFHCESQGQLVIYSYGQPFNVTSVYMPGAFLNKSAVTRQKDKNTQP